MSTSMAPPPSTFAHRRSPRLITSNLPPTPPYSPDSSSCVPRKMSLSKGATFHVSSSPSTEEDPSLSIRHLTRRSPTCSSAILASWLSEKKDIAQSLADFDHTFSGARGKPHRRSANTFEHSLRVQRVALPSDEGLGSSIGSPSEKGVKSFEAALDSLSNKDSGLGGSISDSVKRNPSEVDALYKDLIQETDSTVITAPLSRQSGNTLPRISTRSAVTQSIAPPFKPTSRHPPLSNFARKKISEHIFTPILQEERFGVLHPLVTSLGSKSNKAIRCLRDLEQSLIFQPLTFAITQQLYRSFGEFTVQLVVDTYQHLSETEQRRAADRPYDNGYFLDLVQQVNQLASHISQSQQSGTAEDDEMVYSPSDEVTLEGGLGETGSLAELVRWKNGKGISLRTGQPYEPVPGIKREPSDILDEDVERSMARRKKGYIPEIVEMKCSDKTCNKIFTRKCDLAKHEKTHSRPFKCPEPSCKYHEMGLPTEKERDRHINDKHDPSPHFYKCQFCEFRTKRESNCKQHQEKKHNWHYERAKGKDKVISRSTPSQTPQTPSMEYSPSSMQSPAISYKSSHWDEGSSRAASLAPSAQFTPLDQQMGGFDNFGQAPMYSAPIFPRQATPAQPNQYVQTDMSFGFDTGSMNQYGGQTYISPTNTTPMTPQMMTTPVTPAWSNITGQSPYIQNMDIQMDYTNPTVWEKSLPTTGSLLQPHTRNPSLSYQSPMFSESMDDSFNDPLADSGLPDNDFSLFAGDINPAFSNPAAANATLFPAPESFAKLDNDPDFNMAWEDEAFFDYEHMTN